MLFASDLSSEKLSCEDDWHFLGIVAFVSFVIGLLISRLPEPVHCDIWTYRRD